jgi:YD repeat-containing protein
LGAQDRLEEVIYPDDTPANPTDNPRVRYLYEDARFPNALTGIIDENGERFATWSYDAELRANLSMHADGAERTDIVYDETTNSRTVTNALGKQTIYYHQLVQGRNKMIRAEGLPTLNCPATTGTNTYNADGLIASTTDRNGNITTYQYNSRALEISRTEALGKAGQQTTATEWHPGLPLPTKITEPGRTTDLTYDIAGRLIQRSVTDTTGVSPGGGETRTWTYTYTAEGLLDTLDGPRGDVVDVTDYDYDAAGNLVLVTSPLGHQTQMTAHDNTGRPLTMVDPNGVATDLAYDPRGRLESRTVDPGPNQTVTSFGYDPAGNLTMVTLPDGQVLTYIYDAARRLTEVQNDLGEKIVYTVDALGNRTAQNVYSATGTVERTQSRVFDELGRLLRKVGAANQLTDYGYDLNDNRTMVIDPVGSVTQHAYDALDRLVMTTDGLMGETTYAYDARGNLTSVSDPRGVVTTYRRNRFGEVVELNSPDTGRTVYELDAAGNRVKRTDSQGVVIEFGYDAGNRLTAKSFPTSPSENVTYEYDEPTPGRYGIGRLTRTADPSGWTELSYDARGNVTLERRNLGGVTYDTAYGYDLANRLTEVVYPSGRMVAYQRDALGRVSAVTTKADELAPEVTLAANIAYLPFGPPAELDYGNGQLLTLSYDQDYRLTALQTNDGIAPVQDLAFGYDDSGDVISIFDNLDFTRDQGFTYDDLHRLTQATGLYGQIDYAYNATGNRTSRTVTNGTALTETYFNDLLSNRLDSLDRSDLTSRTLAYNHRGDTTRDTRPDGSVYDLAYDSSGRLAAAARDGTALANARYNARGERVARIAGGTRTHSLYDTGGQLLAEYDAGAATPALVPPAPDATVDNTDAGASATGGWTSAAELPGYLGSDYAVAEGGSSADVFTWTPTVPAVGSYQVFARWPADANRGSPATYTVTHQAGSTAVTVDQRSGGQWVPLGSYALAPGAGHKVTLSGEAEALSGPAEVIVDNRDPGALVAGAWAASTGTGGGVYWGADFHHAAAGTGANAIAWTPALPEAGRWKVFARWSAWWSRATDAPYTVHHSGGVRTVRVDQTVNGGEWVLLGAFDLDPAEGHHVVLTDDADGTVIGDALRFLRDTAAAPAEEVVIDNRDPRTDGHRLQRSRHRRRHLYLAGRRPGPRALEGLCPLDRHGQPGDQRALHGVPRRRGNDDLGQPGDQRRHLGALGRLRPGAGAEPPGRAQRRR